LFRNLKVKTLEGSAAFLGASLLVAILFWSQGLVTSFWIVILGAGIATLIEGLPVPINDNFTVPLGSALVMGIVWST
jgi:dolichol kinase